VLVTSRQNKTRQDKTRQDKARQGRTQGKARLGKVRQGKGTRQTLPKEVGLALGLGLGLRLGLRLNFLVSSWSFLSYFSLTLSVSFLTGVGSLWLMTCVCF
jgi:hypothetical protein